MKQSLGDFIGGHFVAPQGQALTSHNPARNGEVVFETAWDVSRVAQACVAAQEAQPAWRALGFEGRWQALVRFREAIESMADPLSEAITLEMGKLRSEARVEIRALVGRFGLVKGQIEHDLTSGPLPGFPDEELRHQPHGVVGVIGPFNFPLHLCHAHVIPALLTGNTVVIKPSDITPLCGQLYAQAAQAAGLPPGVLNVVNGLGQVGAALVADERVKGLCFTGSWGVGRRILGASLDRPEMLVALEMGGKNTVVVLDDADIRHAAHDIAIGGYLTTGQRCTCTDRVLVQRSKLGALVDALRPLAQNLRFGDPDDAACFAGPMATMAARDRFEAALEAARAGGADAVVPGQRLPGGAFRTASLHVLPEGGAEIHGYTDEELFGPDLSIQIVEDEAEAAAILGRNTYGFANSVFTASAERFEAFYANTRSGILNWNRTTNQASPRLPFGGVGRSGNYRPAGAYAARNTVVPVAVKTALPGAFEPHPMLAPHLVSPDLDALAQKHATEEAAEAARMPHDFPRPTRPNFPKGGHLPASEHWRQRLYARGRMAKEKKPGVYDHLRSWGPWMASVDADPLVTLDAMSQTATLTTGFAPDPVMKAWVEGEFADAALDGGDTALGEHPAAMAYADLLRSVLPQLPHVSFVNSGAESNEKAFALCRLNASNPDADRVLVFEGSLHGRTMLSLHSTWNPVKRAPFEIPGYESTFAPFPLWKTPMEAEPEAPEGFLEAVGGGQMAQVVAQWGQSDDELLASEVASLARVDEVLGEGRTFAVSIEPMQSEGGDRYATARYFRALRLLTRHHGVSLIFDEVQCGFGLGGPIFWFSLFDLIDKDGNPDFPDAVVVAKRAQVGLVMSRFEDPEPTSAHAASLVRGRLHLQWMLDHPDDHKRVQDLVWPRLQDMARRYPHLVHNPRACGFAFAFDLPSSDLLAPYYLQRFWRGAVVFGAGTRTVRYRMSSAFDERAIDMVFEAMRRSLSWIDAHPGHPPPVWAAQPAPAPRPPLEHELRVRVASADEADALMPAVLALEAEVYEPARRDPEHLLRMGFEDPDGIAVVAELHENGQWTLVGSALGSPLERSGTTDGLKNDPMNGRHNTLYSQALSVSPRVQGQGVGKQLKAAQLARAAEMTRPDGSPRYRYVCGRNRVGYTDAMMGLNTIHHAHAVEWLDGQYGDPEGAAYYYRQPVRQAGADPDNAKAAPAVGVNLASGIARPFGAPPQSLVNAERDGLLTGPTISKITICNYITPAVVRSVEFATALVPDHPHVYLTSGRDETTDKAIRTLRYYRKSATIAIGFEGGYVGHTSSGSRSVSDPAVHRQGPAYFDWPRLPHPADVGTEATIEALRGCVEAAGGPEHILGLFFEPMQERTGKVPPADFWPALESLRAEMDLPLVLFETASAMWRSGNGTAFAFQSLPVKPELVAWWGGGQTGFVHLTSRYFIPKPLMMVSTWDGDELSMIRLHHQLRAARTLDQTDALAAAAELDAACAAKGMACHGQGLYRVIEAGEGAEALAKALAEAEIKVRVYPGGRLGVAPHLDSAAGDLRALAAALGKQGDA
mgnify:CR=1 FL=1